MQPRWKWLRIAAISLSLAGFPEVSQAQPAASPPLLDFKDLGFWTEQCRSLASQQHYPEAVKACEQAIRLDTKERKNLEVWKAYSTSLVFLGRYQEALSGLDFVLKAEPAYSLGLTYKCEALLQLHRAETALTACEQALRTDGDWGNRNPNYAWAVKGQVLRRLRQPEMAIVAYDRALLENPQDTEIQMERCETISTLADRLSSKESPNPFVKEMQACESLPTAGFSAHAWFKRGLMFWNLQRSGLALARLDQAPKTPGDKAKEAFEQAVNTDERLLANQPDQPLLWRHQGMALEKLRQYERALIAYDRAVQLNPQDSLTLVNRCSILNRLNQFSAALAACDQALQGNQVWEDGSPAYAWLQRSLALIGLKQYQDGIAAAERAAVLYQEDVTIWETADQPGADQLDNLHPVDWYIQQGKLGRSLALMQKAIGFWYLQQYEAAAQSSEAGIGLNKRLAQSHYSRGRILSAQGRTQDNPIQQIKSYESADQAYDQALQTDLDSNTRLSCQSLEQSGQSPEARLPNDAYFCAEILSNQAAVLWHLHRVAQALDAATAQSAIEKAKTTIARARQFHPMSFNALYNQGLILNAAQEPAAALTAFKQADLLAPGNADVWIGQGDALANLNRNQEAIMAYDTALSLNPNSQIAKIQRDQVIQKLQRPIFPSQPASPNR